MASSLTKSFIAPISVTERMQREEDFFSRGFLMSYSGLNKLLYSPAAFYQHYVLKQRDDSQDQNMIEGSLIHCLLLRPTEFDNFFIISIQDPPSENPKKVLDTLFNHYKELKASGDTRTELSQFEDAILDILRDMNLYQSLKTDAQRLEKMINLRHDEYWRYLTGMEGKTVIGQDTYDFCKAVVDRITSNYNVMDKMGYFGDVFNQITKLNEVELFMSDDKYEFNLRGIIDNMVFDPLGKTVRINDLKKTSKPLTSFKDSIDYYNYWLQAGMYYILAENYIKSQEVYKDWKIEFRFIVVDPYMQIAPIAISKETMEQWVMLTKQKLDEANYHFVNRNFDLPYIYLTERELTL